MKYDRLVHHLRRLGSELRSYTNTRSRMWNFINSGETKSKADVRFGDGVKSGWCCHGRNSCFSDNHLQLSANLRLCKIKKKNLWKF